MIFGVWISTKPFASSVSRNNLQTPASTRKIAWLTGVRLVEGDEAEDQATDDEDLQIDHTIIKSSILIGMGCLDFATTWLVGSHCIFNQQW